jgi:predicted SprT family Zn-dependent metalloprotease
MTESATAVSTEPISHDKQMKRQTYKCACGNVSVQENYMPDEQVLPCLPCGKCKAGQGMDIQAQLYNRKGLMAIGPAELYSIG